MKRLIIINILLVILLNILPEVKEVEAKEEVLQTAEVTAEIISRSSEPRQERIVANNKMMVESDICQSKPTEISQRGIDFIKQYEGFIGKATRLTGEEYLTLGYRTLW